LHVEASTIVLPPVFDWLQREGQVALPEMWRTFNCGIGFVLVVKPEQASAVSISLTALDLSHKTIGQVIAQRGEHRTLIA
jgi:phosphoribosylformylglycinamidine cyclo-ligase